MKKHICKLMIGLLVLSFSLGAGIAPSWANITDDSDIIDDRDRALLQEVYDANIDEAIQDAFEILPDSDLEEIFGNPLPLPVYA